MFWITPKKQEVGFELLYLRAYWCLRSASWYQRRTKVASHYEFIYYARYSGHKEHDEGTQWEAMF